MSVIRCRLAACREPMEDGQAWSFFLINDSDFPFDSAALDTVASEWGDMGHSEPGNVHVTALAPGAHALIWRDDGEFRLELSIRVRMRGQERRLTFEFPKLYRRRDLPPIEGLGKPGFEVRGSVREG